MQDNGCYQSLLISSSEPSYVELDWLEDLEELLNKPSYTRLRPGNRIRRLLYYSMQDLGLFVLQVVVSRLVPLCVRSAWRKVLTLH